MNMTRIEHQLKEITLVSHIAQHGLHAMAAVSILCLTLTLYFYTLYAEAAVSILCLTLTLFYTIYAEAAVSIRTPD